MLTIKDIDWIQMISMSEDSHNAYFDSPFHALNLLELINLICGKIWDAEGKYLSEFLMPDDIQLQSEMRLKMPTQEDEQTVIDFRKILL